MNYDPNTGQPVNNQQIKQTNTPAIVGLVLAIFQFNIISLIVSLIGLSKSKQLNGEGRGIAIAGIALSVIQIIFAIFIIVMTILSLNALVSYVPE